ncbi:hypothetical protein ACSNOI_19235 [Actinomadura kijaniata]|uniref:hypothetical protein n=1 Tax=Actinomadura kijaniata TaxID=46161 RepID=UPI003F1C461F
MPEPTVGPPAETLAEPGDEPHRERPRRVVVTGARTDRARARADRTCADRARARADQARTDPARGDRPAARWSVVRDLDEQTELGAVYVRSLIRAQLRSALVTCAAVAGVLVALPLLFQVPALAQARVHGVPLPWLLLALGLQPLWIGLAVRHARRAERTERDFLQLVERS